MAITLNTPVTQPNGVTVHIRSFSLEFNPPEINVLYEIKDEAGDTMDYKNVFITDPAKVHQLLSVNIPQTKTLGQYLKSQLYSHLRTAHPELDGTENIDIPTITATTTNPKLD